MSLHDCSLPKDIIEVILNKADLQIDTRIAFSKEYHIMPKQVKIPDLLEKNLATIHQRRAAYYSDIQQLPTSWQITNNEYFLDHFVVTLDEVTDVDVSYAFKATGTIEYAFEIMYYDNELLGAYTHRENFYDYFTGEPCTTWLVSDSDFDNENDFDSDFQHAQTQNI